MLIEVTKELFSSHFPAEQHPFLSQKFINLNKHKVDDILYLIQDIKKPSIGLVLGLKGKSFLSPFSAPFGGFHYTHENIYISEIEIFVDDLKAYLLGNKFSKIDITLPPSIYGFTFNSKIINVLLRKGFLIALPDLTNWVDLGKFNLKFKQRNSREYYNQAVRNKLVFRELVNIADKRSAYELITENRKRFGRLIYMDFDDVLNTGDLWPVDFFGVFDESDQIMASGIYYQFPNAIAYALFWGDNEVGRPKRAMDFLSFNLWSHYKAQGFSFIDLGISTENQGIPNEGLLRFKETHEANTELKHKMTWSA